MLRSWPWTIALAGVLIGFVLIGAAGLGARTSGLEVLLSFAVSAAAAAGVVRVLNMGVKVTPSGLIIRDLTRTALVPWDRVRGVTAEQTGRRVYAPVLHLAQAGAGRRGRAPGERLEITVLGSYRVAIAQGRADKIAGARKAATARAR